jgi:hypothetical protein
MDGGRYGHYGWYGMVWMKWMDKYGRIVWIDEMSG